MGFGLLLIGCIITYFGTFLAQISAFTNILGAGIILFSLRKLIYENKLFIASIFLAGLLEISSIISLGIQIFGISSVNTVAVVFAYIADASLLCLAIMLMLSIFLLAKNVELPKLMFTSMLNVGVTSMSIVFYILSQVINNEIAVIRLTLTYIIFQIISSVLMVVVALTSYAKICYEGDEKMQKKGTGVPFYDTLNSMFDKAFSKNKLDKGNGKKK